MLTLDAIAAELKDREATGACFVLKLIQSVSPYDSIFLSDKPLTLNDGTVYNVVREFGGITQSVNLDDHSFSPASVTVTLGNLWNHRNIDGTSGSISDQIRTFFGFIAGIYLFPGGYATNIADGLLIFFGRVSKMAVRGDGTLTLSLDEITDLKDIVLPQNRATLTAFPNLPKDQIDKRMPLAYGAPTEGYLYWKQTGFFPGIPISKSPTASKYLIASHPCHAPGGQVWIGLPSVDSWGVVTAGSTTNLNDAGKTTVTLDPVALRFIAYIMPTGGKATSTGSDPANPVGVVAGFDNDGNTKVSVIAESATRATIEFEWDKNGDSSNDRINNSVAFLDTTVGFGVRYHISLAATVTSKTIEYWNGAAWASFGATSTSIMSVNDFQVGAGWDYSSPTTGVLWHMNTGPGGGDGRPFRIRFVFDGSGWTANTTVVAYIHEVHLALGCKLPGKTNTWTQRLRDPGKRTFGPFGSRLRTFYFSQFEPSPFALPIGFDGIDGGRMFGSWIDEVGRSNPYNSGDAITRAPGIIESILRDELGLTSNEIDVASFDVIHTALTGTTVVSLMDENAISSLEIIRNLCWEYGYFLYRSVTGKMRLVNYTGTGTVAGTIHPWELDELPDIALGMVLPLANQLTIKHTRLPQNNDYQHSFVLSDATSQADYGTVGAEVDMQTMRTTIAAPPARLTDRLIVTEFLSSRPHLMVGLKTTGFRFVAAEIGDLLHMDAPSFDPVQMCMGVTWASKNLMIYQKEVTVTGVEFQCIIWAPPPLT